MAAQVVSVPDRKQNVDPGSRRELGAHQKVDRLPGVLGLAVDRSQLLQGGADTHALRSLRDGADDPQRGDAHLDGIDVGHDLRLAVLIERPGRAHAEGDRAGLAVLNERRAALRAIAIKKTQCAELLVAHAEAERPHAVRVDLVRPALARRGRWGEGLRDDRW
ncbi:hypothetical protein [Nannocystis pusilla]|uniref:hypothetical protein n=1 Tax=Nannocystis pusilla TaxID=889268 RepID=UPI003DA5062C